MAKILIGGAGGAPFEGVINSLLLSKRHEEIIGMGSVPSDLVLSHAKRKYALLDSDLLCYITIAHMYDLLEKCREKLNSTFSYIISIFGDGLKKRVIYHLLIFHTVKLQRHIYIRMG